MPIKVLTEEEVKRIEEACDTLMDIQNEIEERYKDEGMSEEQMDDVEDYELYPTYWLLGARLELDEANGKVNKEIEVEE